MQMVLLDDSIHASTRVNLLQGHDVEHVRSLHEVVGMTPELILIDEAFTPETVNELLSWDLKVCMIAERITIALRRKYPMVQDMVTESSLLDYVQKSFEADETFESPSVDSSSTTASETAATGEKSTKIPEHPIAETSPVSTRNGPGRGAFLLGFLSLRSTGGSAGKTGVLYNFASYMASEGRKTLVIDLDPKGLFGYLAGSEQGLTTEHWVNLMNQNPQGLTERAVFDNVEYQDTYGFYMITAPSREDMIGTEQFRWILEQVRPYFDLILFDHPCMWTKTTLELMQRADYLYLFGVYDQMQYIEFKNSIKNITHPLIGGASTDRLIVVLGRAYIGKNPEIEMEEVKRQLGVDNVFLIPEDPLFQSYRNEHKAIVLEKRSAVSAKAIIPWLKRQLENTTVSSNLPALYVPRQSLLRRLLGLKKRKSASGKGV